MPKTVCLPKKNCMLISDYSFGRFSLFPSALLCIHTHIYIYTHFTLPFTYTYIQMHSTINCPLQKKVRHEKLQAGHKYNEILELYYGIKYTMAKSTMVKST